MRLFLLVYFILLFESIRLHNYIYIAAVVVFGLAVLVLMKIIKVVSIKKTKKAVAVLSANKKANISPFINVNRAKWYIFQELPGFSRAAAKKVIWIKRHNGLYTSVEDFFGKNEIKDEDTRKVLKKLIFVR